MAYRPSISRRVNESPAAAGYESPIEWEGRTTSNRDMLDLGRRLALSLVGDETRFVTIRGSKSRGSEEVEAQLVDPSEQSRMRVTWRDRIGCFTWMWFTMTMATGGMANALHAIPYRSKWLDDVGIAFFLLNIVLFIFNCVMITLRFKWNPGSFTASFTDQSESLFIATCLVSVGTILINITQYLIPISGQWLSSTMEYVFWTYAIVSLLSSCSLYLVIWSNQSFPLQTMTPLWVMPAYPLLLVAPFAASLIGALPSDSDGSRINSLAISIGAIALQGTGFLVSFTINSAFIYRLMTQKLPKETVRPGVFISVGPGGFTVAGIVQLGVLASSRIVPQGYMGNENAGFILRIISLLIGLWLWGLSSWFFIVSVGSHWDVALYHKQLRFQYAMNWFSFVFPNTALTTATQQLGRGLGVEAFSIAATTMTGMLVVVWTFVFVMMIRAVYRGRLLWPAEK